MFKILLVEDEEPLRHLQRIALERAGHHVEEAGDGVAALAAAQESPPDLVVTDIMMPAMDGVELIRRLRTDPATALIPVLASTGDSQIATGADAVLIKPYRPAQLVAVAAKLLGHASPRQLSLTQADVFQP